jgi:hypothetical protein
LTRRGSGYIATCVEVEAEATGATEQDAVAALRSALYEKLYRDVGVAPPSHPEIPHIVLRRAPPALRDEAPFGPGDRAPRSR